MRSIHSFLILASLAVPALVACSGSDSGGEDTQDELRRQESGASAGEQCANGVFGTPNMPCKADLECVFANGTAPVGPPGASSARTGICEKRAKAGEQCANGVFGTPNIKCATGLECVFPQSTAPVGPPGASSARTGNCAKVAQAGETCGNGVFGTPNIACASGLKCAYPDNTTAPAGPPGASSARTGKCEAELEESEEVEVGSTEDADAG